MQTARRPRPRRAAAVSSEKKKKNVPAREMRRAEGGGRPRADRRDLGTSVRVQ